MYLVNFLKQKTRTIEKILILALLHTFTIFVIVSGKHWFNGDEAVVGTIIRSVTELKTTSWYFYGQSYYEILDQIILSLPIVILENSQITLRFLESFSGWY
jgi:hypothetical protein